MVGYLLKILAGETMLSRNYFALALALGMWLSLATRGEAQFTIFNSGGFEGYAVDRLFNQNGWQTTDFGEIIDIPAGVVQSTTTFAGSRAVRVIGPNMWDSETFANQTFWYQDRTATPFNPVTNGTPVVRATWRQMLTGSPGDTGQMPFAGLYFEGFTAGGTQQMITAVFLDNAERLTAITTSGNSVSSPILPNIFNNWQDLQVDLNFTTQRFTVFRNGLPVSPLINLPFRNTFGTTNRLVEFGFEASTLGVVLPPTNDSFYDDYLLIGTSVPEPTTYAMIGLGIASLAGMWTYRRRRNRQAAEEEIEPLEL